MITRPYTLNEFHELFQQSGVIFHGSFGIQYRIPVNPHTMELGFNVLSMNAFYSEIYVGNYLSDRSHETLKNPRYRGLLERLMYKYNKDIATIQLLKEKYNV